MKYILVTGGVISGIGKGVIASSTGLLLRTLGLEVTAIKIDPYLNIDAGTLSPLDHGEVFVLNDGGEVDLDLGNYERYLDVILGSHNNITTGKIYSAVIEKERKGDYLGKTVQVVPHITDAIQEWIERVAHVSVDPCTKATPDVCVIELGGTVGDIESAPFVEALRQFQFRVGQGNFVLVHVSLVPVVGAVGEQKTKPTQSSIRDLRGLGLTPDFIACRCGQDLHESIKQKISMFCHVPPKHVLGVRDCGSVYHVPLLLRAQGLVEMLQEKLNLDSLLKQENLQRGKDLWQQWVALTVQHERLIKTVKIALVGKYTHLQDSYISVKKALEHAGLANGVRVEIEWVEATDLETVSNPADRVKYHRAWQSVCSCQAVLVPGGFGERGHEGKILACQWAREHKVPFLGVCLGMQMAVIEFARNILKWPDAHSEEFDPATKRPVIIFMPEIDKDKMGGTMRLGKRATAFQPNCAESILYKLYDTKDQVDERHRHRYEVNPAFVEELEKAGLWFVGKDADTGVRMEMFELREHPFYVGTQFHPEYLSRPLRPSPPFFGLVRAAIEQLAAASVK